ncbi:hypothetical protein HYFRA_00011696 [Hymenoscyphus fraxineus]|uniref:HAD-like protein n=1 Tax=Hymenoscyphus fraxineus TaxID=746836 RepID=A0A9N9L2G7_9HELO|nr:hypothetical protein HYFRA_00011696 [Hymenoscyphus fraxineus]
MTFQGFVRAVVFDLGDVLLTWSSNTSTRIPSKVLRKFLFSPTWFEYECGRITQKTCYERIADEFSIEASQISEAFAQAHLRQKPWLKVYAMSNVAKEDFAALSANMDWSLFDGVFSSGNAGMRKPDPRFYQHVLHEIQLVAGQVVFVDDKRENVLAAQTLGMKAFVFEDDDSSIRNLETVLDGPVAKGCNFLYRNAKQFNSITESGISVADNFAQLLILEAMQDLSLVDVSWETKETWNFFADDLDTTALALTTFPPEETGTIVCLLDKMLEYVNPDGSIQTYFDLEKPRTDAVVSANVLACFYTYGRGHQLPHTLQYIHDILLSRTYIQGTRYYPSPDCCLGFFTRLLNSSPHDSNLQETLRPLLESRVQERLGEKGSSIDLAMRVISCCILGINCTVDRRTLLDLQCKNGGWENGWIYSYGSTGVRIGNCGVTTALAVKAVAASAAFEMNSSNGHT